MMSIPATLLSAVLVVILSSCAMVPQGQYPLHNAAAEPLLPMAEVTAVLQVDTAGQRSNYLLALRSGPDGLNLALLTPQGGPLYEVTNHHGDLKTTRKLATGDEPSAEELLQTLQLIFGAPEALQNSLAPDWTLQQDNVRRTFRHLESTREIVIKYAGEPPWYSQAQLIDSLHNTILTVLIQEQLNVLPE